MLTEVITPIQMCSSTLTLTRVAKTVSNVDDFDNLFGSLRADLDIYKGLTAGWFGSWRKTDEKYRLLFTRGISKYPGG